MQEAAGKQKRNLYRFMGVSSVVAALLLTLADYLLEFHKEYGLSTSIVEPIWLEMSPWRFSLSIYLCMFMIPFYLLGFWLLYKAVSKTNKTLALVLFVLFSYGVVGLKLFPPLFAYLVPGAINKGNAAMFALAAVNMWDGDEKVTAS